MCQALQEALAALLTLPNSEVYCYLPDRELRPGSLTNAIQNSHSSNSDPNLNPTPHQALLPPKPKESSP